MKKVDQNGDDLDYFIKLFMKNNYITKDSSGLYIPTNSSSNVKLIDVFDLIDEAKAIIPHSAGKKSDEPGKDASQ